MSDEDETGGFAAAPLSMPGVGIEGPDDEGFEGGEVEGDLGFDARDELDVAGSYDHIAAAAAPSDLPHTGESDATGTEMPYDYPGDEPTSPGGQFNRSTASVGLGASSGGVEEEIDINTHGLIEETVQRLSFIHGVLGVLIIDGAGQIVHATMPIEEAARMASPVLTLLDRAKSIVVIDSPDARGEELQMLCVRTRKYEMLLSLEANGAFAICVLQDTNPTNGDAADAPLTSAARSVLQAAAGTVF